MGGPVVTMAKAALKVMSERKLAEIFAEAIKAAELRSRELSGS